MTIEQGHRSPYIQKRWIELKNVGSGTIPAWGAAEVVDVERPEKATTETPNGGRSVWNVRVPTTDDPCNWVINGHCAIPAGEYGKPGTKDSPMLALVESGVVAGDQVGIESGTCELKKDRCGFVVDGDVENGIAQVTRIDNCETVKTVWMKAYDCILPGSTTGTAKVQRKASGGGYEDDPAYASPLSIDNSMCQMIAAKDDMFQAIITQRCGEDDGDPTPFGQWGLHQRVRIYDKIECGASGNGYLLKYTCSGGTGTWTKQTCDPITFANESHIPMGCGLTGSQSGPYEDIDIRLIPGSCCAVATQYNRPMVATATVPDGTCNAGESGIPLTGISYSTHCNWPGPTTGYASNPYTLQACPGSQVEIRFDAQECKWAITQVPWYSVSFLQDMQYAAGCATVGDTLESCKIQVKYGAAFTMSCVCPPGDSDWEDKVTLKVINVLLPPTPPTENPPNCVCDLTQTGWTLQKMAICVFPGCNGDAAQDVTIGSSTVKFSAVDVVTGTGSAASGDTGCVRLTTTKMCGITCGTGTPIQIGEIVVVQESMSFDTCLKQNLIELCVLGKGSTESATPSGVECTSECPPAGS